jgi:hypothetical protein
METMRNLKIEIGDRVFRASLNETPTADSLWEQLPVSGRGQRWGDEIYFDIEHHLPDSDPEEEVDVGDVAYWEPGTSLCLFWGPTPASVDNRPRAASPVTVVGRFRDDPSRLAEIRDIQRIRVSRAS